MIFHNNLKTELEAQGLRASQAAQLSQRALVSVRDPDSENKVESDRERQLIYHSLSKVENHCFFPFAVEILSNADHSYHLSLSEGSYFCAKALSPKATWRENGFLQLRFVVQREGNSGQEP